MIRRRFCRRAGNATRCGVLRSDSDSAFLFCPELYTLQNRRNRPKCRFISAANVNATCTHAHSAQWNRLDAGFCDRCLLFTLTSLLRRCQETNGVRFNSRLEWQLLMCMIGANFSACIGLHKQRIADDDDDVDRRK